MVAAVPPSCSAPPAPLQDHTTSGGAPSKRIVPDGPPQPKSISSEEEDAALLPDRALTTSQQKSPDEQLPATCSQATSTLTPACRPTPAPTNFNQEDFPFVSDYQRLLTTSPLVQQMARVLRRRHGSAACGELLSCLSKKVGRVAAASKKVENSKNSEKELVAGSTGAGDHAVEQKQVDAEEKQVDAVEKLLDNAHTKFAKFEEKELGRLWDALGFDQTPFVTKVEELEDVSVGAAPEEEGAKEAAGVFNMRLEDAEESAFPIPMNPNWHNSDSPPAPQKLLIHWSALRPAFLPYLEDLVTAFVMVYSVEILPRVVVERFGQHLRLMGDAKSDFPPEKFEQLGAFLGVEKKLGLSELIGSALVERSDTLVDMCWNAMFGAEAEVGAGAPPRNDDVKSRFAARAMDALAVSCEHNILKVAYQMLSRDGEFVERMFHLLRGL